MPGLAQGFSSSLVKQTAPDPENPVLPASAVIKSIDILLAPYNPDNEKSYLARNLSWNDMLPVLEGTGF